jgi:hypothetical protein
VNKTIRYTRKALSSLIAANRDGQSSPFARKNWRLSTGVDPIDSAVRAANKLTFNMAVRTVMLVSFIICLAITTYIFVTPDHIIPMELVGPTIIGVAVSAIWLLFLLWKANRYCLLSDDVKNALDFQRCHKIVEGQYQLGECVCTLVPDQLRDTGSFMLGSTPHGHSSPLAPNDDRGNNVAKLLYGPMANIKELSALQRLEVQQQIVRAACLLCGAEAHGVKPEVVIISMRHAIQSATAPTTAASA